MVRGRGARCRDRPRSRGVGDLGGGRRAGRRAPRSRRGPRGSRHRRPCGCDRSRSASSSWRPRRASSRRRPPSASVTAPGRHSPGPRTRARSSTSWSTWCRHPVRCVRRRGAMRATGPRSASTRNWSRSTVARRGPCPSRPPWPFRSRCSPSAVDSDSRPGSHRFPRPSRARSGWPSRARSHSSRAPPAWLGWAVGLRSGLADAASGLGGDGGALVPGLAIGDTTRVGAELDAAMRASSLSHLTAVSGANCAIVTAAAFALAAICGLRRGARVAVALLALLGFVVLVTPQPSVVRAGAMAVVVLVAIATGRPGGGVAALSVAVIGLLAFDPWLARDYGFALSAAATAGLLLLAGPLAERLSRGDADPARRAARRAGRRAARLPADPHPARPRDRALRRAGQPARRARGTRGNRPRTDRVPRAPRAALGRGRDPAGGVGPRVVDRTRRARRFGAPGRSAPVAVRCAGGACCSPPAPRWPCSSCRPACGDARGPWSRRVLAVGLAVPVGVGVGAPAVAGATRPGTWDVAACDVGQGDAVLVRSADATALIDTGPDPAALERCLALLGIGRIDLLVLTHWDADHVGGVDGRGGTGRHGHPRPARRESLRPRARPARARGRGGGRGGRRPAGRPRRRPLARGLARGRGPRRGTTPAW